MILSRSFFDRYMCHSVVYYGVSGLFTNEIKTHISTSHIHIQLIGGGGGVGDGNPNQRRTSSMYTIRMMLEQILTFLHTQHILYTQYQFQSVQIYIHLDTFTRTHTHIHYFLALNNIEESAKIHSAFHHFIFYVIDTTTHLLQIHTFTIIYCGHLYI